MSALEEVTIREFAGVKGLGQAGSVMLEERETDLSILSDGPIGRMCVLTPDQARRVARHLYRLARRVEARAAA